jgi:hypothetical protein
MATALPMPVEQPVIATTLPGSNLDANAIMSLIEYRASSMVDVAYKVKSKSVGYGWLTGRMILRTKHLPIFNNRSGVTGHLPARLHSVVESVSVYSLSIYPYTPYLLTFTTHHCVNLQDDLPYYCEPVLQLFRLGLMG